MKKRLEINLMAKKVDLIFLAIIGAFIVQAFIQRLFFDYVLDINTYLGFVCWAIVLYLRITKPRIGRYALGALLLLGTANILNFFYWQSRMYFSIGNPIWFASPKLNPSTFWLLFIFLMVNIRSILKVILRLFRGSFEEQQLEHQKKIAFYLKRFESCSDVELQNILSNFDAYPEEAQIALEQLRNKSTTTK